MRIAYALNISLIFEKYHSTMNNIMLFAILGAVAHGRRYNSYHRTTQPVRRTGPIKKVDEPNPICHPARCLQFRTRLQARVILALPECCRPIFAPKQSLLTQGLRRRSYFNKYLLDYPNGHAILDILAQ